MFEGFFKSKFLKKCKSSLKRILERIEGIKRKRNAMQKYLKNDIADLLKNEYHLNAYTRAGGLLIEINMTECYDLVEQFCKVILDHLAVMNKEKDCPEECKEAVPSLMFAAARFADLPELRKLRTLFIDKYGKSLESHINQDFVEKLKARNPTKDEKLKLLDDVALEFEIEWNPKDLEQQLYKPPSSTEVVCSENIDDSEAKIKRTRNEPVQERKKQNLLFKKKKKQNLERDVTSRINHENEILSRRKEVHVEKTEEKVIKERVEEINPVSFSLLPPPYTKLKSSDSNTSPQVSPDSSGNTSQDDSVHRENRPRPKSIRKKNLKPSPGREKASTSHSRAASLGEVSNNEKRKGHSRTFSLPENSDVNSNLLDYDDFIARLAALKKN